MYGRGKKLRKPKTQKQSEENIINSIRNHFVLRKEKKEINDRIIGDVKALFEEDDDKSYKPKRVSNFWNINYIKYESNDDRNKNLSNLTNLDLTFFSIIIRLHKSKIKQKYIQQSPNHNILCCRGKLKS